MAVTRSARPGMAASPNQKLVLDELVRLYKILTRDGDDPHIGFRIRFIHWHLKDRKIGGNIHPRTGEWKSWHYSTVRDHMNDLVAKELLTKQSIQGTNYYKPVGYDSY